MNQTLNHPSPATPRPARPLLRVATLVILVVVAGCQSAQVTRVPRGVRNFDPLWKSPVGSSARADLSARGLSLDFAVHPRNVLASIESEAIARPSPARLLTLGGLAFRLGQRTANAEESALLYRDAAVYGSLVASDPAANEGEVAEAVELHNRALTECLEATRPRHGDDPVPPAVRLAALNIAMETPDRDLDPAQFDRIEAADAYRVGGLTLHRREGFGVPLVAARDLPERELRQGLDRFYARHLVPPLTAVLLAGGAPSGGSWRDAPVRLVTFDPTTRGCVAIGARNLPLAGDFTTPLAYQAEGMRASALELGGVLDAEKFTGDTGIYQMHPYRPGKIPVLFVHGLASSPGAWVPMFNELRADPALRARYQFWFAYYPTGLPAPVSVARLRQELHELQKAVDPTGTDAALGEMVVIGHSMGGLVSRQLIQASDDRVWNAYFSRPPGQVVLPAESKDWVHRIFFFEPEPSIRRAIFIAAPHRGSSMANRLIGRVSSALASRSPKIGELREQLVALNGPDVFQPAYRRRMLSSIDNLEWNSPLLKTQDSLRMAPGVPFHSIVGNITPFADASRWSDGVVQFTSAHLEGAESELVVPYFHTRCNTEPEPIAEVRRILLLHAGPRADPPAGDP